MIYLDHAATTLPKPKPVIDAVAEAMQYAGNAARGVNAFALHSGRILQETRELLAERCGLKDSRRVCFTNNATEALNIAINGSVQPGDRVVTTAMEHNSVLRPLYRLEELGLIGLTILPADARGRIRLEELKEVLQQKGSGRTILVIGHASNLSGNVVDLQTIGRICSENNTLLIVDAAQTAGIIPIDMENMHIDILCLTGHKALLGPQGTGAILLGPKAEIRPWKVGGTGIHSFDHGQPQAYPDRLEAGTLNIHGIAGLRAALLLLKAEGLEKLREREVALARRLYEGLRRISAENGNLILFYGDFSEWEGEAGRTGIVTINLGDYSSGEVSDELMERFGIATRSGAHCAPLAHRTFGTQKQGALRFSVSWQNTEAEIDAAIAAMRELAEEEKF